METLILSEMLVRSSVFAFIASLISGLLCCSEHGAAQYVKSARYDGPPSRRSDPVAEFFYRSAYRRPSSAATPYHQDADGYQDERFNSNIEAAEENFEYYNEEQQVEEVPQRSSFERAENAASGMQTSASHAQPVKSERTAGVSRFSGNSYKSGYGSSYSITLQPGAIAVTCTVKDPLEHIVWLRSLCPDEYDRGDVIAKGSVSSFPDVYSVSVSGADGEFSSTLTIEKPRTQMGSGVFRCEAWPHHGSDHHRRHRRQAGREGRGHHNPWNGIILGGHEMVDECFFNHYGRQYRAMDSQARTTGNQIAAESKPSSSFQQPIEEINETSASYLGTNLFPEFAEETDYDAIMKLLKEGGSSELADLAAADVSHVPQIDNRNQRHTYPQEFQGPYPVFVPTANMQKQEQPLMHYQSRRVNLQSGGQDVRTDIEMSTDLQVHPHRESTPNRVAFSRMIQVEGTSPQQ